MYAAPAQAVFATTPFAFTILAFKGKIRNSLGTYWMSTIKARVLFVWALDSFTAGIIPQTIICRTEETKNLRSP